MITDFASLKTEINNWLVRTEADSDLETFIQFSENRFNDTFKTFDMERRFDQDLSTEFLAVPDDFLGARKLSIKTDPIRVLNFVPSERLRELRAGTVSGIPKNYTIENGEFQFAPAPNDTFTLELLYWQRVPPLTDSNTTNWLLDNHSDIYLFSSLLNAQLFIGADSRASLWQTALDQRMAEFEFADKRTRQGAARVQAQPVVDERLP